MDKVYDHTLVEDTIYEQWEKGGYFKPEIHPNGKPYCIVLPPPNANGALHFGHAMFTVEDILIRYHRMLGDSALWLPGSDHAGIETQFVFEKQLAKEGKSRFDFNREKLYEMIRKYVDENRGGIQKQLKKLGYSLDWSREKYTLDPAIVELVVQTFRKMYNEKMVYRDYRLVNYCTFDGTSFSDLEVISEEYDGILYRIDFPIKEGGIITIATTRPETLVGDVAVMVHPEDTRYKDIIGKTVILPIVNREIPIIADEYVQMDFGTGAVKVTPSHDFNDFEIAKKHKLYFPPIIGFDGKMQNTGVVDGLYVKQARAKVVEELEKLHLLKDQQPHKMVIRKCYKCKNILEPLPLEQWYVNVQNLKQQAMDVVKNGKLAIVPKSFENPYFQWLENLRDWNISRQNVWGIRIPVWYEVENEEWFAVTFLDKEGKSHQGKLHELLKDHAFEEITKGLQRVIAFMDAKVVFEDQKTEGRRYLPETDTFDTWFSSGQWPIVTLKTAEPGDFEKFYPTAVLETAYDILKAWVSRMVMFGLYLTDEVPFKTALFHGIVNDPYGKKMSKSKGNVVNPLEIVEQYGADAVRFALVYGNATGADQSLSYTKLDAARKFTNKLWNMARFLEMKKPEGTGSVQRIELHALSTFAKHQADKDMVEKTKVFVRDITKYLENYQFNLAAEGLYEFTWHVFADKYIEEVKNRVDENSYTVLTNLYITILHLLHPIMPFVTEEIFAKQGMGTTPLIVSTWPKA